MVKILLFSLGLGLIIILGNFPFSPISFFLGFLGGSALGGLKIKEISPHLHLNILLERHLTFPEKFLLGSICFGSVNLVVMLLQSYPFLKRIILGLSLGVLLSYSLTLYLWVRVKELRLRKTIYSTFPELK